MNKTIINNIEYNFLKENKHLGSNICLLGLGGSRAYGTNLPTSDIDIRGIAINTKEELLLGKDFETVVETNTDTTIYSLNKIFDLLTNANPNCLEMMYLRDKDYLFINNYGQELLNNRDMFLSQRCINSFGGYATQQMYRLQQKSLVALSEEEYNKHISKVLNNMQEHLSNKYGLNLYTYVSSDGQLMLDTDKFKFNDTSIPLENIAGILSELNNTIRDYNKHSKRNEQALAHGKIAKHSMHLLRLYMMCNELLLNGTTTTYRAKEHNLLMDIRNGLYLGEDGKPTKEFFDLVRDYEDKFEYAKTHTILPKEPDMERINKLKMSMNEQIITDNNFNKTKDIYNDYEID